MTWRAFQLKILFLLNTAYRDQNQCSEMAQPYIGNLLVADTFASRCYQDIYWSLLPGHLLVAVTRTFNIRCYQDIH